MSFELLALTGEKAGVRYALEPGTTVVGRASDSDIQVLDDAVSRHHARFVRDQDAVTVEDLGSQNGSALNGAPLRAPTRLTPGDAVVIGATTFVFAPRLELLRGPKTDVIWAEDVTAATQASRRVRGDEQSEEARAAAAALLAGLGAEGEGARLVSRALDALMARFSALRGFVVRVPAEAPEGGTVLASAGQGPITISRTLVQAVLQGPTALFCEDTASDAVLAAGLSLQLGGVRSLVAAPVVVGGRVLGLVALDRPERGAFSAADVDRLVPLAGVLGLAVLAQEAFATERRRASASHRVEAPNVVAVSEPMRALVAQTRRAAGHASQVLITGPTGSGKEVFARLLHAEGPRAGGPFVAVNCAALPEALESATLFGHEAGAFTGARGARAGLFEAAEGGTIFLDEIGETSRSTQVKLLRVLQERVVTRLGASRPTPIDVRIVAATHRDLDAEVLEGRFREDLFYRLAVVRLRVPALAARPEDVLPLARRFAEEIAHEAGRPTPSFTRALEAALVGYGWPGNVRELRNTIERLVILGADPLDLADLPAEQWSGPDAAQRAIERAESLAEAVGRLERGMILRAMQRTGGVKSATAEALGISRVTLDAKLRAHGITWRRG